MPKGRYHLCLFSMAVVLAVGLCGPARGQSKADGKKFSSKVVDARTPGHAVDVEVDITGAKKLYLVVTDGGNGFSCDWADWAEPKLVGPGGEKKLTELKWQSATSDWGKVQVGRNAGGGELKIAGKPVEYGIGTHANSVIAFDLPEGYTKFTARGGLDNGGSDQGDTTSVQFHVLLDELPKNFVRKSGGGGGGRDPEDALASLDVGAGMEANIFAAEPMMLNPTNIDIDAKGRIWVCEVVNYRGRNGTRPEGDRILVVEDTDGDGQADKTTTFYQGRDIDSAHGVCVLGDRVIVSAGDKVHVFIDKDGDLKPESREVLFTGIAGTQHDHGIHSFLFGPDGRLYFNFGNAGRYIKDKNGKAIVDAAGNEVNDSRRPYQEGMVFRCDLDGSNFETLGWNFRNNWEVAVDSFGTIWQSDNDDDGNRGVRINYVMEYGNYGYRDEKTGAGWRDARTNLEAEIPLRHWHLNDPGVVPNLLQTGAGSPTGICVYEADLLPERFRGEVIHCDAGPNVVRAYPVVKDGAGYKATIEDVLVGTRDKWFRPSDVGVAPDGSLIVADWYDPGVGGHGMGDIDRGRLFRVTPTGMKGYKVPQYDYTTAEGAAEALKSPTPSIRYLAWTALHGMQAKAEPALLALYKSDNPRFRARALWLLGQIEGKGGHYVDAAVKDENPDIRIVGLRLARLLKADVLGTVAKLAHDPSPAVRRECAIALHDHDSAEAARLWAELAAQHEAGDRWELEALGIGARGDWDACLGAYLAKVDGKWDTPAGHDVVWRSRAAKTPEYLVKIIEQAGVGRDELPRYFRAFDFLDGEGRDHALVELAFAEVKGGPERANFIAAESLGRLKNFNAADPKYRAAIDRVLDRSRGTTQFVNLVAKFNVADRYPEVLEIAQKNPDSQLGVDAITALLERDQTALIRDQLRGQDVDKAVATAQALGTAAEGKAIGLLRPLVADPKADIRLRRQAVRSLGQIRKGALDLVEMAKADSLDQQLREAAAAALHQAQWRDVKSEAEKLFPLPEGKGNAKLPPIAELLEKGGDAARGRLVFQKGGTCATCHVVNGEGKEVGPDLSEIGNKLSRQGLFESILFPSAAISHNFESYAVLLNNGNIVNGLKVSETPGEVSVKGADGIVRTHKRSEIEEVVKQPVSLMPADLAKLMSTQDLVDVVDYLATLKKAAPMKSGRLDAPVSPLATEPARVARAEPRREAVVGATPAKE